MNIKISLVVMTFILQIYIKFIQNLNNSVPEELLTVFKISNQ